MKRLIVLDLNGTLALNNAQVDAEMSELLDALLERVKVAVISGGDWPKFETQLLDNLSQDGLLQNLSILPTCGTKFYHYESEWKQLYADELNAAEKEKITRCLKEAVATAELASDKTWGDQIVDRGTQITFSALGQQAPLEKKLRWDPEFTKRRQIAALLAESIPEFTVRLGGATSIDITKLGIDKAYGIKKLREHLGIELDEMHFFGDAIFPGGNDYPVKQAGVMSTQVANPEETKRAIGELIESMNYDHPNHFARR